MDRSAGAAPASAWWAGLLPAGGGR